MFPKTPPNEKTSGLPDQLTIPLEGKGNRYHVSNLPGEDVGRDVEHLDNVRTTYLPSM